jgi:glycosyltransferase involved in cell wall biosynthesis
VRALQIAPQPFFSPRGTPFSVYYRCLVLSELGVSVDVLTYGQGDDPDLPGVRVIRIPDLPWLGPIRIGPSFAKLVLDLLLLAWTVGLLVRNRYDFVQAHEESVFFCRLLKPLFGFKLVYDMHSSLPQQLANFEFTKSKALVGLFEKLEDGSLAAADAVITICPELAEYAIPRMPDAGRHFLIENSIFEPVRLKRDGGARTSGRAADGDVPAWAAKIPLRRPIVAYAGTFEAYQGLDLVLEAFGRVAAERPDAFLVLAGGTPEQVDAHRKIAKGLGLGEEHVLFLGSVSRAVAQELTAAADVLLSPRKRGTNTPLKIYEQLASGVPLVATRIRSHTQVLSDDVCFLAEPDPASMADAILRALGDDGERRAVAARAKKLYEERYSRRRYVERMQRLLEVLR